MFEVFEVFFLSAVHEEVLLLISVVSECSLFLTIQIKYKITSLKFVVYDYIGGKLGLVSFLCAKG